MAGPKPSRTARSTTFALSRVAASCSPMKAFAAAVAKSLGALVNVDSASGPITKSTRLASVLNAFQ